MIMDLSPPETDPSRRSVPAPIYEHLPQPKAFLFFLNYQDQTRDMRKLAMT